jgi:hypothetical protein
MEMCYARRTINNMLAFVQTQFASAVNGFLAAEQSAMQTAVVAGFLILPLALALMLIFARQLRADCAFAIKCFRILPRIFIMKVATCKKLQQFGVLNEIELIAV